MACPFNRLCLAWSSSGEERVVPREPLRGVLTLMTLLVTGALSLTAIGGTRPLTSLTMGMLLILGAALYSGAVLLITTVFLAVVVELGAGLVTGSIRPEWVPYLAAGLFLAVELALMVLEVGSHVEAPTEPVVQRVLWVTSATLGVWAVAALVRVLSGAAGEPGAYAQIAGVTAAVAIVAIISRLLRNRLAE